MHSGGIALGTEEKAFMELIPRPSLRNYCHPEESLGFHKDGQKQTNKQHLPKIIQICPSKRFLNQNLNRMGSSWEDLSLGSQPRGSAADLSELVFFSTGQLMSLAYCCCES